jgi:phenylacetaldehyde dehydrogenase
MATALKLVSPTDNVTSFISRKHKILINGKWVDAASGKTFPTFDPATGEVLAQVAEGDAEDINRAVTAARAAFESGPWPNMTASERGRLVWKLADLLEENLQEFAEIESLDKRQATERGAGRRCSAGGRPVSLHGGVGDED